MQILLKYSDKVILELAGHDHIADVRYHNHVLPNGEKTYFHNLLLSPGLSSKDGQNPGFAVFQIDKTTLVPWGLEMTFIDLAKTYGMENVPPLYEIPKFVMSASNYGLKDLTPLSLHDF